MKNRLPSIATAALSILAASSLAACVSVSTNPPDEPQRVVAASQAPDEPQETPAPEDTPTPEDPPTPEESLNPVEGDDDVPDTEAVHEALDRYVEAERATIPQVLKENPGVYSEVAFDKEYPDMATFTYTYATPVDVKQTAAALDDMIPTIESFLTSTVFPAMEAYGVVPTQRVRFTYLNNDGAMVWSKDFASS